MRRAAVCLVIAAALVAPADAQEAGPRFRADGPDMAAFSRDGKFPTCPARSFLDDRACRANTFSDFGKLHPSRLVRAPAQASPLRRAAREPAIRYDNGGRTLDDYLNAFPVTGLLIAHDDEILVERYQYGRSDKQPLTSFSMAKTIIGLLTGLALERGAMKSLNDTAETYVSELKGTEYGRTPIKSLLLMSSGVQFSEVYSDYTSDIYKLSRLVLGQDPGGAVRALPLFNDRIAPPGKRFSYASSETAVLGLVVARATGRTISDLTAEWLWQPIGAEADATWNVDARGQEVSYAYYNAVLRDWARLGLMLAHRGQWAGRQIVPQKWIADSTTEQPDWVVSRYGYQVWISPTDRNTFYLGGRYGQFVMVNPARRLVVVQTSLDGNELQFRKLNAIAASLANLPK